MPLDGVRRPSDPGTRQPRREGAVHRGERRGEPLPVRQRSDPRDAERDVGRDSDGDGVGDLLRRQLQHLGRGRRCGDPDEERIVPTAIAQLHRVGEGSEDLVADMQSEQQVAAAAVHLLGRREHGRDHVAGVPAAVAQVVVVEVEEADERGVGERRVLGGRAMAESDHRRPGVAAGRRGDVHHSATHRRAVAPEGAPDRVEVVAHEAVDGNRRHLVRVRHVSGEALDGGVEVGDRGRRHHPAPVFSEADRSANAWAPAYPPVVIIWAVQQR